MDLVTRQPSDRSRPRKDDTVDAREPVCPIGGRSSNAGSFANGCLTVMRRDSTIDMELREKESQALGGSWLNLLEYPNDQTETYQNRLVNVS
jgi:hypothetical protein